MRRFAIDPRGTAATGEAPCAYGIEWPDGTVTVRMRNRRDDRLAEPCYFRTLAGLEETVNAKVRFLDPPRFACERCWAPLPESDLRVMSGAELTLREWLSTHPDAHAPLCRECAT